MIDVSTEIVVGRRRDEVAVYAADPANAPAWYENIENARQEGEGRVAFVAGRSR